MSEGRIKRAMEYLVKALAQIDRTFDVSRELRAAKKPPNAKMTDSILAISMAVRTAALALADETGDHSYINKHRDVSLPRAKRGGRS